MFKKIATFLIFALVFSVTLNAQQRVDASLIKCYGDRYHDLSNNPTHDLAVFQNFESQLLQAGMLQDKTKESYAMLMANLLNDDIEIPVSLWSSSNPDLYMLSMPSNLATSMLCFNDIYETQGLSLDKSSSVLSMSPFVKKIIEEYNIGDKSNNIRLVRAVHADDFDKMIYKAPILSLLHSIASYKEEMNQLTSNF